MFANRSFWTRRLLAAGIHLGLSALVAGLAAGLVFGVWYPYPYREISGGRELFLIVVTVDVILGPLLTLTVFNIKKPVKELRRDLAVIAVLQLAALGYGMWTVAIARPVHLVFEVDRFRVVHAIDVPQEELKQAPAGLDRLPLTGPTLLSMREFTNEKESFEATMAAMQGVSLSARPGLWQAYEKGKSKILKAARPLEQLKSRFPGRAAEIDAALRSAGRGATSVGYVPMVGRQTFWTVLLDNNTAEVIAFVPIDSF
ncbi:MULTISPECIES: TfpX/TfpZ family type IV pilin accessory protein [unclassified Polaromonas]|uniref:TfpX/TfpZ family type IV pilin accessory protein n=1 Tax=unclassified Polaromonas TaxID=2638319 RepID=UPI000F097779|nr:MULTISPECIES: TfpX/TfpZ family type IV pilin accessory protein [unclassified Polaromonas]AYQ27922.1 pilus assembly protein [Polaromonas sp. SP1]QGJ17217.1 pilus assembly protein [Polaromonas sp. Pch-P]